MFQPREPLTLMNKFAPEYSKEERFGILVKTLAWSFVLFLMVQYVFLPWFETYAENAHCYSYGAITGTEGVIYFSFVGLPLIAGLGFLAFTGPRIYTILKVGQSPLPGEKVFKPTKYVYGWRAKAHSALLASIIILFIGFSIRGVFWADEMILSLNTNVQAQCIQIS